MSYYNITINAKQVSLNFSASDPEKNSGTDGVQIASLAEAEIRNLLREKYTPYKITNLRLADAYQLTNLDYRTNKAVRLATCARWLEFALPPLGDDKRYKLVKTSSCHVRLCPVCQWRRSLNTFRNLAQVYDRLNQEYKHIFLTLTLPNVSAAELSAELSRYSDGFVKMLRRKPFADIVKGYTRALEITYNPGRKNFHPHLHAILSVPRSYGKKVYISQEKFLQEWEDITGWVPSEHKNVHLQVNVKAIKSVDGKSIAELAKYSVKPGDYIRPTLAETAEIIEELDPAVDNRRFLSYGGVAKRAKRELFQEKNLEDIEADTIGPEWEEWERKVYEWHFSSESYREITV
ncbi:MAG: protein rep [Clostridia bacterium]|nr:protein rep [Clostridia bacterium]